MPRSVGHELLEVGAAERVAPRQDQDRRGIAERGHAVDQATALLGRQLARIAMGHRLGPAVDAGERAGPGRLPDDDEGSLLERTGHGRAGSAGA